MARTQAEVEDIYRPYKQKKRTRAIIAKEKGLEPLAEIILKQDGSVSLEEVAKEYIKIENDETGDMIKDKSVETVEDAIAGAKDIIAEDISDLSLSVK